MLGSVSASSCSIDPPDLTPLGRVREISAVSSTLLSSRSENGDPVYLSLLFTLRALLLASAYLQLLSYSTTHVVGISIARTLGMHNRDVHPPFKGPYKAWVPPLFNFTDSGFSH